MPWTRRTWLKTAAAAASMMTPGALWAQAMTLEQAQQALIYGASDGIGAALEVVRGYGRADIAPALILALRFSSIPRELIAGALRDITGATLGDDWFDWMLWQEAQKDLVPHASFAPLKRDLFLRIDPNFADFLKPEYLPREKMKIRFEEITWGGVHKDGIPSLDNPELIAPERADYLRDDDLVFGVSINGDVRAYPLRIMGWHEMFNEVIGGVPVALAYCTLCGSGILYETQVPGRDTPFVFGSSGFLYRSNKLMFDRQTHSLWNQFTGKPVVGPLADSGIVLEQRPVVVARWAGWRASNPGTRVLSLSTGHRRNYGSGIVYQDYFSSPELMFPAAVDQSQLSAKSYVFGLRVQGAAKAWPLASFAQEPVINDDIGGLPVVLIGDPATRSVRAYERGDREFVGRDGEILAGDLSRWQITEDALVGPDQRLPRMAGHIAYWFAWDNYLGAETEVYGQQATPEN